MCMCACSDSKSGDTVISLAIMSNPRIINATSVVFPMVSNLASTTQKPSSVATYYQNQAPMKAAGTVSDVGSFSFLFTLRQALLRSTLTWPRMTTQVATFYQNQAPVKAAGAVVNSCTQSLQMFKRFRVGHESTLRAC